MKFPPGGKGHFAEKFQSECLVEEIKKKTSIWMYRWMIDHSWESKRRNKVLWMKGFLTTRHPLIIPIIGPYFLGGLHLAWGPLGISHDIISPMAFFPPHLTTASMTSRVRIVPVGLPGLITASGGCAKSIKKLHVCPWEMLLGRLLSLWDFAYFQGLC